MKYYKRKIIMAVLFLFIGIMILLTGILRLGTGSNSVAFFQIFVALIFAYDAYAYLMPFLGLDEEKLIVNNGPLKKEIIYTKNIISMEEKNNKLVITFTQGSSTRCLKIMLSHLKQHDKVQLLQDLKLVIGTRSEYIG